MSAPVAHGGSSASSAQSQATPIVEHVRPDDNDEHVGSKKLTLSEPGVRMRTCRVMTCGSRVSWSDVSGSELRANRMILCGAELLDGSQRTIPGGRWSRRTSTVSCSLRFVEAAAGSERCSHCGDFQSAQDSSHAESKGPDAWTALRHVTQLLGP